MSHTVEHVCLRKPCPCGQGVVLMIYHDADPSADLQGYFHPPEILCPECVKMYRADYRAHPDRVELTRKGAASNPRTQAVIYGVDVAPSAHLTEVQHAQC